MNPFVLIGAAGALGVVGFSLWKGKKAQEASPSQGPPVTPNGHATTPAAVSPAAAQAAAQYLGTSLPPGGYTDFANYLQTGSPVIPSAHALYDHLVKAGKRVPYDPSTGRATAATMVLVKNFQKAHNASQIGKGLAGTLTEDGEYNPFTSAALTVYTGDPIPADANAALPPTATLGQTLTAKTFGEGGTNAGSAYASGFNVVQWLKKNGTANTADPSLAQLVMQFQHDANTDPQYPGAAYALSPKPPLMTPKLPTLGALGPQGSDTRNALKRITSPDDNLYGWL